MSETDGTNGPLVDDGTADLLRRQDTWASPPESLEDDVLAALRHERDHQDDPEPRRSRARRIAAALVLAACCALLGGAVVLLVDREPGADLEVALEPTALAPAATAKAELRETPSGVSIQLQVDGLRPAPPGSYYQGWVKSAEGDLVTIGTFHAREGGDDIVLWSGVDVADYRTITVTLQREGEGPASSGQVVLKGTVTPTGE